MDNKLNGVVTCGYYDTDSIGEHTYAKSKPLKTKFHCYGGIGGKRSKHLVDPAEFWEPKIFGSKSKGKSLKVDMNLARYIAANGNKGWKGRDTFDKHSGGWFDLGDCSGRVYAIDGVCHQMANSIFTSCGKVQSSPVVWPPSFNATWLAYGWRGTLILADPIPLRLRFLLVSYPDAVSAEDDRASIDALADIVRQLQDDDSRRQQLQQLFEGNAGALANLDSIMGDDRMFRGRKLELDRSLLRGEIGNEAYARDVNTESRVRMAALGAYMPEPSDAASGEADLIHTELMPSEETYQEIGARIL